VIKKKMIQTVQSKYFVYWHNQIADRIFSTQRKESVLKSDTIEVFERRKLKLSINNCDLPFIKAKN
jgi:hypothetical protein